MNLTAEVPGWTRFQAAQDWLAHQQIANTQAVQARFNTFLTQAAPAGGKLSDASREALFQQFLTWDRKRAAAH